MISRRGRAFLLAASILAGTVPGADPGADETKPVVYLLGKNAAYQRGCFAPCMCPVMEEGTVQGRFVLQPAGSDGLFDYYNVLAVDWIVTLPNGTIHVVGSGTFRIGGEFAAQEQLTLDLSLDGEEMQQFDSGLVAGGSDFPAIDLPISLNGMYCFDTVFYVRAHPAIDLRTSQSVDDMQAVARDPGIQASDSDCH